MARRRKQKITPRALLELKMPGDVQVAPDNLRIVYGVSETDWDDNAVTQHLYLLKVGSDAEPRQITRGDGSETQPRWSPDGNWLAFLSSRDDGEGDYDDGDEPQEQVWLLPMDGNGGEAEPLTDAPEGIGDYGWLPDSSGIVYLAQEPRPKPLEEYRAEKKDRKDDAVVERDEKFRQQIWRIDREGKKAKLVHPGDFGLGEIAVSPDGKSVAFTTNYTGEVNDYHKSDVWVVEVESGVTRPLADGPGGKFHPVWAAGGSSVLYVAPLDPALSYSQPNLYAVSASEPSEPINLTADFPPRFNRLARDLHRQRRIGICAGGGRHDNGGLSLGRRFLVARNPKRRTPARLPCRAQWKHRLCRKLHGRCAGAVLAGAGPQAPRNADRPEPRLGRQLPFGPNAACFLEVSRRLRD